MPSLAFTSTSLMTPCPPGLLHPFLRWVSGGQLGKEPPACRQRPDGIRSLTGRASTFTTGVDSTCRDVQDVQSEKAVSGHTWDAAANPECCPPKV